jgi:hypothetical protein
MVSLNMVQVTVLDEVFRALVPHWFKFIRTRIPTAVLSRWSEAQLFTTTIVLRSTCEVLSSFFTFQGFRSLEL